MRIGMLLLAFVSVSAVGGQWTWDFNGDLDMRGGDLPLTAVGTHSFEAATINGATAQVVRFTGGDAGDPDTYFTVTNPAGPNGGGVSTNTYTLIMDVRFDEASWAALYQTNADNSNDGDWFIRADGGMGISGDYTDPGNPRRFGWGAWHRIALVVDLNADVYRSYLDGELQNAVQADFDPDGRFSLGGVFHLFADQNGETQDVGWCNAVQLRDYAMSAADIAALGPATAAGPPGDSDPPVTSIRVGPFLQSAAPNSIWVVWETSFGDESVVEYGTSTSLGETATGTAAPSQGAARIHQVQLTGLAPRTRYYYRVKTGVETSDVFHFRTPPPVNSEQPLRFIVFSDTQRDDGNADKFRELVNDGILAFVTEEFGPDVDDEIAFVLTAGDLVNAGSNYSDWVNDYFGEARNLFEYVPLYPALGNHEQDAHWYYDYMRLPENGTAGFEEHWYYVDYGNVRIISLDTDDGYRVPQQLNWLDDVLADACTNDWIDFVFAEFHHPYKSECWLPGELAYSGEIVRRLEQFSTDCGKPSAHFYGHTHAYSRGQSRDHDHLWVNVASGEGNIDYWGEYAQADYPEYQRSFVEWGFVVIEVRAGSDPQFRLRRVSLGNEFVPRDNEVVDDITIRTSNVPPAAPMCVSPGAADSPVSPDEVLLQADAYSDPDGDTHLASHFQVALGTGRFDEPAAEAWIRFENWYAPPGASGPANGHHSVNTVTDPDLTRTTVTGLASNQVYSWRVRYRDAGLRWSDWSAPQMFQTSMSSQGANRLANPGAEADTTGWTIIDPPLEVLAAHACDSGTAPVSGSHFFAVGGVCADESAYGEACQTVDVSLHASVIDAGDAMATYGGYLKDFSGTDRPDVWLVFKDADGSTLGSTDKLSALVSTWTLVEDTVPIPAGTRAVAFHLSGTRLGGTDNDSYADDLMLRISPPAPGDVNHDGALNATDFVLWSGCLAGPGVSLTCDPVLQPRSDLDGDGDADVADYAALQRAFNGVGRAAGD